MPAGKHGPADVVFLVDGYNMLANKITSLAVKVEAIQVRSDGLGDSFEENSPTGVSRVEITQGDAFFDTATDRSHAALSGSVPSSARAIPRIICIAMAGNTIGEPSILIEGAFSMEYEPIASSDDLTKANVAYQITGKLEHGTIMQAFGNITADFNTESSGEVDYTLDRKQQVLPITSSAISNPCNVTMALAHGLTTGDKILIAGHSGSAPSLNGAQTVIVVSATNITLTGVNCTTGGTGGTVVRADSANGGAGYLQVNQSTGFSAFVAKIRDSPDDSTYADLVTFADNVSAPFVERVTVAGDVDRYLAADGNITGSGNMDVFISFARS
jgi:hypothetical protein